MTTIRFLYFVCFTMCMPFLKGHAQSFSESPILMTIGNESVPLEVFEESYIQRIAQTGVNDTPREREAHLNYLIDTFLLKQEAKRLDLHLRNDAQQFMQRKLQRTLVHAYLKREVHDHIQPPTEKDLRTAFVRSQSNVFVRQLYFTNRTEAEEYENRLHQGEDFVTLANELYQTSSYDTTAGFIGELNYFDIDDHYAEAVYELEVGEISPIIMATNGYYIAKLENIKRNPLLTETTFQQQKSKLSFLVNERNHKKSATDFIRSEMAKLNVQLEYGAIKKLYSIVQSLFQEEETLPKREFTNQEITLVEQSFSGSTPLASYLGKDGKTRVFTAEDFYFWIPMIPAQDVLNTTNAAIGKAMYYNEFSERGKALELEKTPLVQFDQFYVESFHLAEQTLRHLRELPVESMSEDFLEKMRPLFEQAPKNESTASYTAIECTSFSEAEKIKALLVQKKIDLSTLENVRIKEHQLVRTDYELGNYLAKIPLNTWSIVGTKSSFFVIKVNTFNEYFLSSEEAEEKQRQAFTSRYHEFKRLSELRESTSISVDTTVFLSSMNHLDLN